MTIIENGGGERREMRMGMRGTVGDNARRGGLSGEVRLAEFRLAYV